MSYSHREKLKKMASDSITKTFRAALEEVEILIASIASQMNDDDVHKLKLRFEKLEAAKDIIRKRILRAGNNEIRALCEELDNWQVERKGYAVDQVVFGDSIKVKG